MIRLALLSDLESVLQITHDAISEIYSHYYAEAKIAERFSHIHIDSSLAAKEMYLKRGYKEKKTCIIPADNGDILIYDEMEKRVDKL